MKGKFSLFLLLFFSLSFVAFGQTRQVTGRVVSDSASSVLTGVNVTVKGSNQVTATDAKGNFSLSIPNLSNVVLVFS